MRADAITVSVNWVRSLLLFAEQAGVDTAVIARQLSLSLKFDQSQALRLSIDDTVRIWRACASASGDPFFGLRFGMQVRPGTFHVVGYTLMNSATLREAFEKLRRYQRLISDGGALQLVQGRRGMWLVYHTRPNREPFSYHQIDAVLAAVVVFSRFMTAHDFVPVEVCFRRAAPADISAYLDLFQCQVSFESDFDAVLLSEEVLDATLVDADEELCQVHEEHARLRLQQLGEVDSWSQRVRTFANQHLVEGEVTRASVASSLGLSERSLHRKLANEGVSFLDLLDDIRRQHALAYVGDTRLPLVTVGQMLGFADASSFYRAFRRWTGTTPGAFRKGG